MVSSFLHSSISSCMTVQDSKYLNKKKEKKKENPLFLLVYPRKEFYLSVCFYLLTLILTIEHYRVRVIILVS